MLCSLKSSLHIVLNIELTYPSLDLFILPILYLSYHPSTMVFTAAQITSFFEDTDQCGLDHRTRVSLLNVEEITSMDDLADWEDDDWDRWVTSYKKPDTDLTTCCQPHSQLLHWCMSLHVMGTHRDEALPSSSLTVSPLSWKHSLIQRGSPLCHKVE